MRNTIGVDGDDGGGDGGSGGGSACSLNNGRAYFSNSAGACYIVRFCTRLPPSRENAVTPARPPTNFVSHSGQIKFFPSSVPFQATARALFELGLCCVRLECGTKVRGECKNHCIPHHRLEARDRNRETGERASAPAVH